ncbi:cupin domain-containing protein [Methylovulum miyakonense]|uniref:cupin domain-containing protein n=1 Tax=Methylovulum miyakonense TaxID=645578 RepID=UPI0003624D68|nr:cupin domain-containing protein [Methylovulum miyakonense]
MTSKTDPSAPSEPSGTSVEQTELGRLLAEHIMPVTPELRVHPSLAGRLQERIARSVAAHSSLLTVRAKNGVWQTLKKGIQFKMLWQGDQGNSVLINFAPGAVLPEHKHNWLEEGIVLRGGLQVGDLDLGVFDYHAAPSGSHHQRIQSRQGGLAYLRGTSVGNAPAVARELLGGLLPFGKAESQTVFADEVDGWHTIAAGVSRKHLYSDGVLASCLLRMEAGATVALHGHPQNEECMMLSGELFLGDILLRAGDYQLAPAGSTHGEAYSDVGALLFLRGSAD